MATLTRRKIYKNGGASYSRPGVRASVYCGPKMFANGAPETIELGDAGLSTPVDLEAEKASKQAAKDAKAAERKAVSDKKKADKLAAKETARVAREAAAASATAAPVATGAPA